MKICQQTWGDCFGPLSARGIAFGLAVLIVLAAVMLAVRAPAEGNIANPVVTEPWRHESGSTVTLVAVSPLAGVYATASRAQDVIEIRDIRQALLDTITAERIREAMPWADLSGETCGPCSLAFTGSGRQIFMGVCSGGGFAADGQPKDALLAYNLNTKQLRVFDRLLLDGAPKASVRYGLAHFKGELFAGSGNGLHRYAAQRNTVSGDPIESLVPPDSPIVTGLAVDFADAKLYVSTPGRLYRADLKAPRLSLGAPISSIDGIKAITFGRTYGPPETNGLYVLRNNGSQSTLLFAPTSRMRAGGSLDLTPYATFGSDLADIAATACGRMLLATASPCVMSDKRDRHLSFDAWVQDEFDQYVKAIKACCWPDGLVPEGFLVRKIVRSGEDRPLGPVADLSGWAIYMLLADYLVNRDPEAEDLIRLILQRHAGLHPDGKGGVRTIDGHFFRNYDQSGDPVDENGSIYTTMKLLPAAYKAAEIFPNNADVLRCKEFLRATMKRSSDVLKANARLTWQSDDHGPIAKNNRAWNETWIWADLAAAQDPIATRGYAQSLYDRNDIPRWDDWLKDEPVMKSDHAAFIIFGGALILKHHRTGGWLDLYRNYYACSMAAGDDMGAPFFTAFSAGHQPNSPGYYADGPSDHPNDIIHFPAVCGLGMMGDRSPVGGAYMAYREGLRRKMEGSSRHPEIDMLTRWSMKDPSYVMPSIGIADFHFGIFGLAETLRPGVVESLAGEFYRPEARQSLTPRGEVVLTYSEITPRRVLGSDDGANWTSYGFQLTPFVFEPGVSHRQYRVVDPEGEMLNLVNAGFEQGMTGWRTFGDFAFSVSNNPRIAGASFQVRASATSPEGGTMQTLDVSLDLANTRYIIRGEGLMSADGRGRGFIRIQWDDDTNPSNGIISAQESGGMDRVNCGVEFRIDAVKPAKARYIHLSFVVVAPSQDGAAYAFDNLSVVRLGAAAPVPNGGFEDGSLRGWTPGPGASRFSLTDNPAMVLEGRHAVVCAMAPGAEEETAVLNRDFDVSGDPPGTRYIFRLKANGLNMSDSTFAVKAQVLDATGATAIVREDLLNLGAGPRGDFPFTMRKRPGDATYRLTFQVSRGTTNTTDTDCLAIDDLRLDKERVF